MGAVSTPEPERSDNYIFCAVRLHVGRVFLRTGGEKEFADIFSS